MASLESLRDQAIKYINAAGEKTLVRINAILENEQNNKDWLNDSQCLRELGRLEDQLGTVVLSPDTDITKLRPSELLGE